MRTGLGNLFLHRSHSLFFLYKSTVLHDMDIQNVLIKTDYYKKLSFFKTPAGVSPIILYLKIQSQLWLTYNEKYCIIKKTLLYGAGMQV